MKRQPKAAIIDCDNTLWKGVVGEDGPTSVKANVVLMRVLKKAKENGMLLFTLHQKTLKVTFKQHLRAILLGSN